MIIMNRYSRQKLLLMRCTAACFAVHVSEFQVTITKMEIRGVYDCAAMALADDCLHDAESIVLKVEVCGGIGMPCCIIL